MQTEKSNGEKCKNPAMRNDSFCYWHSSKISEIEKNENRSRGGKNKIIKLNGNFPEFKLRTIKDILKLNSLMVNKVLANELDLRISRGIAYLLNLQVRCIETSEIEKRLDAAENKITKIVVKLPPEMEGTYN